MNIEIKKYPSNLTKGEINQFSITVESLWNNPIPNMYAKIVVGGDTIQTPTIMLSPWKQGTLIGHINTISMPTGLQPLEITILSDNREFKKVEGFIDIIELEEEIEKEPVEVKEVNSTMIIVYGLIGIVIALLIFIFFWTRRNKDNKKNSENKK